MNEFAEVSKIVTDGMRSIARGIGEVADRIRSLAMSAELESRKPVAASPVAARKQPGKKSTTEREVTAKNTVLDLIGRKRKGTDVYALKEETGFDDKKIYNLIYILKKEGKIRSLRRGVFVKS